MGVALLVMAGCVTQPPEPQRLKVMAWNIEAQGLNQECFDSLVGIVKASGADVLLVVETYGRHEQLMKALGWYGCACSYSDSMSMYSRYPIVKYEEPYTPEAKPYLFGGFKAIWGTAVAELDVNGRRVRVCPTSLSFWPDVDRISEGPEAALEHELQPSPYGSRRIDQVRNIIKALEPYAAEADRIPLILGGDFNSLSHLDWTPETANYFDHAGQVIAWPVSKALADAGYVDTYRAINPCALTAPGISYMFDRWAREVRQIRLDYIYAKGAARPVASEMFNARYHKPTTFRGKTFTYPSDHGFVLTTFEL